MTKTHDLYVYPCLFEDVNSGLVWVPEKFISERSVVKIKHGDKTVFCEAIPMGKRFEKRYKEARGTGVNNELNKDECIVMSEYYRDKLCIHEDILKKKQVKFQIILFDCKFVRWGAENIAMMEHPQVVVGQSAQLGRLSIMLGLLGAFLGLFGIFFSIRNLSQESLSNLELISACGITIITMMPIVAGGISWVMAKCK